MNNNIDHLKTLIPHLHEAVARSGHHILLSPSSSLTIDPAFFSPLLHHNLLPPPLKQKKIFFIDGGNTEILSGVNYSLQFIRIACLGYTDNKQIFSTHKEAFCLSTIVPRNNSLFFTTSLTPQLCKIPDYSIHDKTLSSSTSPPLISLLCNISRRFCELTLATQLIDTLFPGDSLILDGLLTPRVTGESVLVEDLLLCAQKKGISVFGLAKTSRLMTETGSSAIDSLFAKDPGGSWRYSAPQQGNELTTHFVKLSPHSRHIFRIESPRFCLPEFSLVLDLLVHNSQDPVFLGYPYGLIATDRIARVSAQEQEYLLLLLQSVAGKNYRGLSQSLASINAHDILDNIS